MANQGGRPPKLNTEERAEVLDAFEKYIARTPDPIIVGFCAWDDVAIKYDVTDDNINDWADHPDDIGFTRLKRRAIKKQEAYLATGATQGKLNASMSIFRLKQPVHGYVDKVESDINQKISGELNVGTPDPAKAAAYKQFLEGK